MDDREAFEAHLVRHGLAGQAQSLNPAITMFLRTAKRGFAPLDTKVPTIPGTGGIPSLGQAFEIRPSGLAAPYTRPTQPRDAMASYIEPSEIDLPTLSVDDIDGLLAHVHVSAALTLLAALADYADRASGSLEEQDRVAETFLNPILARRAKAKCRDTGRVVFSAQLALLLARRAVRCCPAGTDDTMWDDTRLMETAWLLGALTLALGATLKLVLTPEDATLEAARLQHFFHDRDDFAYSDAHEILFEALPRTTSSVDLEQVVRDAYGVSFRSMWALTALTGLAYMRDQKDMVRKIIDSVQPPLKEAWLRLWSVTPQNAAAAWASDDTTSTPWDISAFYKRPLVDLPTSELGEVYFPIRSAFMIDKAMVSEALWIAADLLDSDVRAQLLTDLGRAYEDVAHERLREYMPDPARLLSERELSAFGSEGGVCDCLLTYPQEWVAFEFVRHSLTKRALADGDWHDLLHDLQLGAVNKLMQIDATVSRLLTGDDLSAPRRVFSVVVVGGHLPVNPSTYDAIISSLGARHPRSLLVDARCQMPAILDLVDLRFACAAALQLGTTLAAVLAEYLASDLSAMPLGHWMKDAHPEVSPHRGSREESPTWLTDAYRWAMES